MYDMITAIHSYKTIYRCTLKFFNRWKSHKISTYFPHCLSQKATGEWAKAFGSQIQEELKVFSSVYTAPSLHKGMSMNCCLAPWMGEAKGKFPEEKRSLVNSLKMFSRDTWLPDPTPPPRLPALSSKGSGLIAELLHSHCDTSCSTKTEIK